MEEMTMNNEAMENETSVEAVPDTSIVPVEAEGNSYNNDCENDSGLDLKTVGVVGLAVVGLGVIAVKKGIPLAKKGIAYIKDKVAHKKDEESDVVENKSDDETSDKEETKEN